MNKGAVMSREQTVVHNTFVVEKSYPKPVETVFAAFADATKKSRWYAGERRPESYSLDFRVGGRELLSYKAPEGTPIAGMMLTNEGEFQDIVPDERIVEAMTMMLDDKRISSSLVTIEFLATETGTDLIFTHQGAFFEGSGGPQMREEGWRVLLDKLGKELARG